MALQVLYQLDVSEVNPEEGIRLYYDQFDDDQFDAVLTPRAFMEELVLGVYRNRLKLDEFIASASENWRLERMSPVDRNILRIALYEMLFCPDIPPKVSINEAIDLGKTFGTHDSGSFINGVLDHLLRELSPKGLIHNESPT